MLPTLVIGLREGLEAALIVGIIAAFLRKQGRRDLLRAVFVGVGAAVLLCGAAGALLDAVSHNLPQRQQEGLETVIGVLAVGMVTYMVIWTKRHSRGLKGQLEGLAADAMTSSGSGASRAGWAMVAMAFLAVLREGLETAVFLIAAFNETGSGAGAAAGAVIGIAASVVLGYAIYRGGVRINLSRFFRTTGLVLVLVAAGLVVNALHTAHEAGWLQVGQSRTVDLSGLVDPGSVQSSLLTGILGIQSRPVLIEVVGWVLYLIPVGLFVAWPPSRRVPPRRLAVALTTTAAVLAIGAGVLALVRPDAPAARPVTTAGEVTTRLLAVHGSYAELSVQGRRVTVRRSGTGQVGGVATVLYTARTPTPVAGLTPSLPEAQVARLNGGRLPLGLQPAADGTVPVRYSGDRVFTAAVEPRTGRVVDVHGTETVTAAAVIGQDDVPLADPVSTRSSALPPAARDRAAATAATEVQRLDARASLDTAARVCLLLAVPALLGALALSAAARRQAALQVDSQADQADPRPSSQQDPQTDPATALVES